ncbi:MAG: hypothetical protein H7Y12_03710 [Sphingobacteriaceae bacterium]|nr:hypothetical protein [Cytophagaceae bacterium]
MSKRLLRFFPTDFAAKLPELIGADVHVVRNDGVTLHGRLLSHDKSSLVLQDFLRHRHTLRLDEVEEILRDTVAPW